MGVDAARHHQQPVRIDAACAAQVHPDGGDAAVGDPHVGQEHIGWRHYRAAGDYQIIIGHVRRPLSRV